MSRVVVRIGAVIIALVTASILVPEETSQGLLEVLRERSVDGVSTT
jgi:hypothetical protein